MLNITKGNVVPMHAILMVDDEIFPVINAENVEVYIQGVFQRYECIHHVEESEDNVVYLEAPDTLPTGVYGVEVKGKMNDVPWRTYTKDVLKITYATEKGDNEPVVPSSDTYDITMEVQLYKTASSDEKIREHNEDHEAHPYIQGLISEVEGKIPVLPEHIVTDEDYVHTDNNFTTEEKEKLGGLANYDDAEVRGLISQKQDVIPDLATIRSGAEKGATAYQKPADGIPMADFTQEVRLNIGTGVDAAQGVTAIEEKIPSQASSTNQLADKDFVNSSIRTATETLQDKLTWDNTPTAGSDNPVKSSGIKTELNKKQDKTFVEQVAFTAGQATAKSIDPNKIYECTFVDVMSFAFNSATVTNTEKCEYCIKFNVGAAVPTLTLPNSIKWAEEIELEANTHYVLLINYENGALYGDWKSYPLT